MLVGQIIAGLFIVICLTLAQKAFFLFFGGVLIAVLLHSSGNLLSRWTGVSQKFATIMSTLLLVGLGLGGASWFFPQVGQQIDLLLEKLPQALENVRAQAMDYQWIQDLFEQGKKWDWTEKGAAVLSRTARLLTGVFDGLTSAFLIFVLGLYMSLTPYIYTEPLLRLFPDKEKPRVRDLGIRLYRELQAWLVGKLIGMAVVGLLTMLGLTLLGIDLALILGLIAGALSFIPNIGPILSVVPAALIALESSVLDGLYVVALYGFVQFVEGFFITPIIQRRAVYLPPAALLIFQIFMVVIYGFWGLFFATPLLVSILVLVKKLWIEDFVQSE